MRERLFGVQYSYIGVEEGPGKRSAVRMESTDAGCSRGSRLLYELKRRDRVIYVCTAILGSESESWAAIVQEEACKERPGAAKSLV